MKTIQVSDEMHDFLINISKELNTQDHRCTAMPYFFQIMDVEKVPSVEGKGTLAYFYDGHIIETEKEIEDAVNEYKDWDESTTMFNHLQDYEIEEIMENVGYSKVWYEEKEIFKNAFFTEKGCKEHINANKHHYDKPNDFLMHAFRNPEMEMIMKFLAELTGGKLHK